jgi:hypothetical protein
MSHTKQESQKRARVKEDRSRMILMMRGKLWITALPLLWTLAQSQSVDEGR